MLNTRIAVFTTCPDCRSDTTGIAINYNRDTPRQIVTHWYHIPIQLDTVVSPTEARCGKVHAT